MRPLRLKAFICFLYLLLAAALTSCFVQTDNSVNGDANVYAATPPGTSKGFLQVSAILKKNCVPCHANDLASYTEQELVAQNYIVPGRPEDSLLYGRLTGSRGKAGLKEDMPQGKPPLSPDDIRSIHDWIEQVQAITITPTPVPSVSTPNTPFGNAQAILLTNCATCHHHQAWNQFAESDFIAKGLVDPGSADGSELYQRLIGANVPGTDPGDMPETGDPLTAVQLQTIATWIDQINAPQPSPSPSATPTPTPTPSVAVSPTPTPTPTPSPSASVTLLNASQRTAAALAVVSNSCSDCHGHVKTATSTAFQGVSVAAFANFTADSDFVTAGLVNPSNPSASWLIRSLKGYGDIASMPQDDDALSADDEAALTTWIAGIGQP